MSPAEWSALRISLIVASSAVAITLPVGVALGWILARGRFRGKALLESLVFLPLVLPPVVTGYLLLVLFGREGVIGSLLSKAGLDVVFTLQGMILAAAVVGLPLMVRSVRVAFEGVDPGLMQAARTLGFGPWRAFAKVAIPLARPGIIAGALLAFARALGEFGATIMVASNLPGTRTLALEIYRQASVPGGETAIARLAALSVVLSLGALLATEWFLTRTRRGRP